MRTVAQPTSVEQVQAAVRSLAQVRPAGGGSKPALSANANLSLRGLAGVLEYEPEEYTFSALAGTPVAEVQRLLLANGQYLPFDPPLADAGATLGGTVAAGLSGPGRLRYGGVRDFLLGVRFVGPDGDLLTGGGKVVKNAAGFDLPKLMVGSLGRFGVLVELTFKVFPRPAACATLMFDLPDLGAAVEAMSGLAASALEPACLDLEPPGRLWIRIGGTPELLAGRIERIRRFLGVAPEVLPRDESTGTVPGRTDPAGETRRGDMLTGEADETAWQAARGFSWLPRGHSPEHSLVKIPIVPGQIRQLERLLLGVDQHVPRRYSVAGNVAWLAWPSVLSTERFLGILRELDRPALALTGDWPQPELGALQGQGFSRRLLHVLDAGGKFRYAPTP